MLNPKHRVGFSRLKNGSFHKGNIRPRTLVGLVLIGLALLVFLNNIGVKLLGVVLANWPVAMVLVGVGLIYAARQNKQQHVGVLPYVLIVLGAIFMLAKFGIFNISLAKLVVPLALLFIGLYFLRMHNGLGDCFSRCSPFRSQANTDRAESPGSGQKRLSANVDADNKIDVFTLLGGGNYNTRSKNLDSGSIVCVLGGAEIDIRDADTGRDTIEIDMLAFMGGAELKIPPHWQVTVKVIPLLGGISNKTTCLADKMGVPKKHLVITGLAFMGGLEVRN